MSTGDCRWWKPSECTGTSACPPRCPRFVTPDGRTYTVVSSPDENQGVRDEREAATEQEAPDDGSTGTVDSLVVLSGDDEIGRADRTPDHAIVSLSEGADASVGVELVRQLVARAVEEDGSTLCIETPAQVASELDDDLIGATQDGVVEIDLTGSAAARTRRPPIDRSDVAVSTDLTAMFAPDRVAVVGATDRDGSIGRAVVENLDREFEGDVVPVSTTTTEVLGRRAVDDVADAEADLAIVVLPADAAVAAVESAAAAGVDAIAVLSAGFAETGSDDGRRREERLAAVADAHDVALVGPNALGVLSTRREMNASFSPELPDAGGVSILSHSGAMVTATIDWANDAGVGVRDVVSLGNAAGIDEADLLRYWGADDGTDVVFAYLEDVQDGDRFVEAARAVSRTTPIVALKAGRSEAGGAAAASHTGALAGDDAGFRAAFADAGVVRAASQQDAYDLVTCFSRQPLPTGDQVAVVTNAGGPGVLAADAIADADVALASFAEGTRSTLAERLPGPATAQNPVDVLGDASVDRFVDALETVLGDPAVDAALVVSTPHPLVDQSALVDRVGDASRRYGKPVVTCLSGGPPNAQTRAALSAAGVPNYRDAVRAARSLSAYASYAAWRRRGVGNPERVAADRERAGELVDRALTGGRKTLGVDAMDVLDAYGISVPRSTFVEQVPNADGVGADGSTGGSWAVETSALDGPFAVKVASPDLVHKSDVGGVRVDVPSNEVEEAVRGVVQAVRENAPNATVDGVLVEELAPDGVECVAGVTTHPRFGPMVTFGLGGVLVEHLEDVAHALAPVSHEQARRLVSSLDGASVLEGVRGEDPVDVDALADAIVRLSWLAVDMDDFVELEVNPLVATSTGTVAVDFHAELDTDDAELDTDDAETESGDAGLAPDGSDLTTD